MGTSCTQRLSAKNNRNLKANRSWKGPKAQQNCQGEWSPDLDCACLTCTTAGGLWKSNLCFMLWGAQCTGWKHTLFQEGTWSRGSLFPPLHLYIRILCSQHILQIFWGTTKNKVRTRLIQSSSFLHWLTVFVTRRPFLHWLTVFVTLLYFQHFEYVIPLPFVFHCYQWYVNCSSHCDVLVHKKSFFSYAFKIFLFFNSFRMMCTGVGIFVFFSSFMLSELPECVDLCFVNWESIQPLFLQYFFFFLSVLTFESSHMHILMMSHISLRLCAFFFISIYVLQIA